VTDPGSRGVLADRVAIVTGANHGIGAATAVALAARGASVLVTYLRLEDPPDPGTPEAHRANRARDASAVLAQIAAAGGAGHAAEGDLSDPRVPAWLFDQAERELGPVDILVNNATGWLADTFKASDTDRLGRTLTPVSATTFDRLFAVDARGGALMIAEFARRHLARGARYGRRGQGGAERLHAGGRLRTGRRRDHRQRGAPAGDRHRLGDQRGARGRGREQGPGARGHAGTGRRRDRLSRRGASRPDHRQHHPAEVSVRPGRKILRTLDCRHRI